MKRARFQPYFNEKTPRPIIYLRTYEPNDNASDAEWSFNNDGLRRNGKDEIL